MSDLILIEMRGAVALLTFNRPSKLNALSYALIDRLMAVLDRIEDDANVRAVVLTGAGDRAFSAARSACRGSPAASGHWNAS